MPRSPRSGNSVISSKSLDPGGPPWCARRAVSLDKMRIVNLNDEPWHIARLSQWHHREWVHFYPDEQVADFARELDACRGEQLVPSTFIATDGRLLGSASLLAADLPTHPELSPWVASVYVRRAARGGGVGSALIRHIMDVATCGGLSSLYLFTPDRVELYQRLDWVEIGREVYQGIPVTLMQVDLGTPRQGRDALQPGTESCQPGTSTYARTLEHRANSMGIRALIKQAHSVRHLLEFQYR